MNAFIEPTHFNLSDVFTFGVEFNKFGDGYSLALKLDEETKSKIQDLAATHDTKNPIYGENILYLKFGAISNKQRLELLNCGKCHVHVNFEVTGVYASKLGTKYLVFRVSGLGRSETQETAPEDL